MDRLSQWWPAEQNWNGIEALDGNLRRHICSLRDWIQQSLGRTGRPVLKSLKTRQTIHNPCPKQYRHLSTMKTLNFRARTICHQIISSLPVKRVFITINKKWSITNITERVSCLLDCIIVKVNVNYSCIKLLDEYEKRTIIIYICCYGL